MGTGWTGPEWLLIIERELLLFAGVFFLLGALDELAVDLTWFWLRITGRAKSGRVETAPMRAAPLRGRAAVFIPCWREERVIAHTLRHALAAWPQDGLQFYVGVYPNDPASLRAIEEGAGGDDRVRIVTIGHPGPTTKADCLSALYRAMEADERMAGEAVRMIVLQDAEDMVHPAALGVLDSLMDEAEFVQLPVIPLPQGGRRWIGSHYVEEFAEAHAKAMVVRDAIGSSLPAAGVGCAFSRPMLARLAEAAGQDTPFDEASLTEDYELGLRVAEHGGRSRFVRLRDENGRLIGTRAFFPSSLARSVRQKARWMNGIALHGWDRMGWRSGAAEMWMRLRDRRGPLSALVLLAGYTLLVLAVIGVSLRQQGFGGGLELDGLMLVLLYANLASFAWRALMRLAFTAREHGLAEGLLAVLRIPVANVINIMAGLRALWSYGRQLRGAAVLWDKTDHDDHPLGAATQPVAR